MTLKLKQKFRQKVAWVLIFLISFQVAYPTTASALTSGPSQPEFTSFEPVSTTQMVDLFSGDFTYNIPLFELPGPDGGYPFNLAYHSNITMDQEASWVGLGWSLNSGAITRSMRGFPDDFDGEEITRKIDIKPNRTWGIGLNPHLEVFGYEAPMNGEGGSSGNGQVSLALNVSHNNYKGWGLGFGLGLNSATEGFFNGGLNLGVNSFDGASLTPNLSFGKKLKGPGGKGVRISLSAPINGREGVQAISLGASFSYTTTKNDEKNKMTTVNYRDGRLSSSYSFGKTSYSPQVDLPYTGINLRSSLELGGWTGANNLGGDVNVTFSEQKIKGKPNSTFATFRTNAYGFFNMKNLGENENSLLDFNRSKDGTVRKSTTNLAIPATTPDIYSVTGQGIGGSYQAFRSDIGLLQDPFVRSKSGGGEFGGELGFGAAFDLGTDLGGNWSGESNKRVELNSNIESFLNYKELNSNTTGEQFYFKSAGEMTAEPIDEYDYIDNENPLAIKRVGNRLDGNSFTKKNNEIFLPDLEEDGLRSNRKPKASSIQYITNKDLLGDNILNGSSMDIDEALGEYAIEYYEMNGGLTDLNNTQKLIRSGSDKQVAAMTSLHPNGARYVYGLPVKNKKQEQYTFSANAIDRNDCAMTIDVPNSNMERTEITSDAAGYRVSEDNDPATNSLSASEDYYDHTSIPEYVHSYLLTSVLGADYVDLDDIPGPSQGDRGYWVKFTYAKASEDYGWRAPYNDANLLHGFRSIDKDDKGSFTYGEREQFYLATAETRTHLAYFDISMREDSKGAHGAMDKSNEVAAANSSKLDAIRVFSKLELQKSSAQPLKQVNFNYSYDLCPGTHNSTATNSGKLTLTELSFSYENSNRGTLTPYTFEYNEQANYTYDPRHYDAWGTCKPLDLDNDGLNDDDDDKEECINVYPYTYQNTSKEKMNEAASVWQLSAINMPSGSRVVVDYEMDDYAYVQDRVAMQMFEIEGFGTENNSSISYNCGSPNANDLLKILFKPEGSFTSLTDVKKYLTDIHNIKFEEDGTISSNSNAQVHYKVSADLIGTNEYETVSGYAFINGYGIDATSGLPYVEIKEIEVGKKNSKKPYHPFSVAAWQLIKTQFSDKVSGNDSLNDSSSESLGEATGQLISSFGEIIDIFRNFYSTCCNRGFAQNFDLDRSWIRLNSPDKVKYGGGSRVKQITFEDNWASQTGSDDNVNTYGQVFDYTTKDEEGNTISSGVASNEPATAYDECALKYAKFNRNEALFRSDDNYFFEYPINETYFPGAGIGYSKVTVKSLATSFAMGEQVIEEQVQTLPNTGFGTTGINVSEFYTAKDFPILTEETILDKTHPSLWIPIGIGTITDERYTGSQGYSITLNDMHGKPFRTTQYALDKLGNPQGEIVNQITYTYDEQEEKVVRSASGKRQKTRILENEQQVLLSNETIGGNADIETQLLGVDYEFFTDTRGHQSNSGSFSLGLNISFTPTVVLVPSAWPTFSSGTSRSRMAVTNKVIRKKGILKEVDAYDGQAHIITRNEVFDPLTGEALLTTVNNSFDNSIYSLSIPARYSYEGMGAAYENWGMRFTGIFAENTANCAGEFQVSNIIDGTADANTDVFSKLFEGDEFIISVGGTPQATATCLGKADGGTIFIDLTSKNVEDISISGPVSLLLTRSGKRNHLQVKSGAIAALENPMQNRAPVNTTYNLPSPTQSSSVPLSYNTIDGVLSASATTFSDTWDLERGCAIDDEAIVVVPSVPSICQCIVIETERFEPASSNQPCTDADISWFIDGEEFYDNISVNYPNEEGIVEIEEFLCAEEGEIIESVSINFVPEDSDNASCTSFYSMRARIESQYCDGTPLNSTPIADGEQRCLIATFANFSVPAYNTDEWCRKGSVFITNESQGDFALTLPSALNNGLVSPECPAYIEEHPSNPAPYNECKVLYCTGNAAFGMDDVEVDFFNEGYSPQCEVGASGVVFNVVTIDISTGDESGGGNGSGSDSGGSGDIAKSSNLYSIGEKGVWRPKRNYVYVEDRSPQANSSTVADLDLENNGDFDGLPMFVWNDPFFPISPAGAKWKHTGETTKYSYFGSEVESRDILGRYSSALYGYDGHLATSVASNTGFYELGFNGFEQDQFSSQTEFEIGEYPLSVAGHLKFNCNSDVLLRTQSYNIIGAYRGGNEIWIDRPFSTVSTLPSAVFINFTSKEGDTYYEEAEVVAMESMELSETGVNNLFFQEPITRLIINTDDFCRSYAYQPFSGQATLADCVQPPLAGCTGVAISKVAHTGKQSLRISSGRYSFPQPIMKLEEGKDYTISAWVNVPDSPSSVFSFDNAVVSVSSEPGVSVNFEPTGEIIEGWQRVQGDFTYMGGNFSIGLSTTAPKALFDDIRVIPKEGVAECYVYDVTDYRLSATLDNNHYATFYHYDEEGNLFLVKKETAEGIKTIQESKGYVKEKL